MQSTWWWWGGGGGFIIEANIALQELEGQRGEGAYFWEDMVYYYLSIKSTSTDKKIIKKGKNILCQSNYIISFLSIRFYIFTWAGSVYLLWHFEGVVSWNHQIISKKKFGWCSKAIMKADVVG